MDLSATKEANFAIHKRLIRWAISKPSHRYLIVAIPLIALVDFSTAFHSNPFLWVTVMPGVWIFYLGYPIIFALLFFRWRWSDKRGFLALAVLSLALEGIVFGNPLAFTFPALFIGIPLIFSIYSFITLMPKWFAEGSLRNHSKISILMLAVYGVASFLSFLSQ